MLITVLVFRYFKISINTMTLGGLAVAIGELVDDAIVDVENVFRVCARIDISRIRAGAGSDLPRLERSPNSIVFATIIVVLVFIPLFALSGIEGQIFAPLGIAYITSIIASLVVSLTGHAGLCSYLLPKMKMVAHAGTRGSCAGIKTSKRRCSRSGFRFSNFVLVATTVVFLAAIATVPFFGREFLPPFNEGSLTINLFLPVGSSLAESNRIAKLAEKLVLEVPEVKQAGRRTGRAELDEHAEGVHYNEIDTELRPVRSRSRGDPERHPRETRHDPGRRLEHRSADLTSHRSRALRRARAGRR
jgi:Cu/Ag efflux pump CusA